MVQVNWTFQAKSDLKSVAEYIDRDSKLYAKFQVARIKNRANILKSQILLGKIVPEIDKNSIRELIEGRYRVIYKIVSKNRIDILTIHHSSRDLKNRNIK